MTESIAPYRINVADLARRKIYAGIPDDDVQLALAICAKYQLDPLLRHVVLVRGRVKEATEWKTRYSVYITRDGLLSWAHETKIPFSIRLALPVKAENPYSGKADIYLEGTLYRTGYPDYTAGLWFSEYVQNYEGKPTGAWGSHPAAMHGKVIEVYLLRRGFNVSLTPFEEIQATLQGAVVEPTPDAHTVAVDTVTGEIVSDTAQSADAAPNGAARQPRPQEAKVEFYSTCTRLVQTRRLDPKGVEEIKVRFGDGHGNTDWGAALAWVRGLELPEEHGQTEAQQQATGGAA